MSTAQKLIQAKISIPAHRPIKAIYIKKLIKLIKTGKGDNE